MFVLRFLFLFLWHVDLLNGTIVVVIVEWISVLFSSQGASFSFWSRQYYHSQFVSVETEAQNHLSQTLISARTLLFRSPIPEHIFKLCALLPLLIHGNRSHHFMFLSYRITHYNKKVSKVKHIIEISQQANIKFKCQAILTKYHWEPQYIKDVMSSLCSLRMKKLSFVMLWSLGVSTICKHIN